MTVDVASILLRTGRASFRFMGNEVKYCFADEELEHVAKNMSDIQVPAAAMTTAYAEVEPKRAEVDRLAGATMVEFGSPWCGHCRRAQPLIAEALAAHPRVRHIKIADASGKRLGRSFRVKLWPTLLFLKDGKEIERLVRPTEVKPIVNALEKIQ